MKQRRMDRMLLSMSVLGFFLMSASFLLMPSDKARYTPGILFWGGLAVGVALQIVLEIRRRAFFAAYKVSRKKMQKPRNGLLTFSSSRLAAVVDILMIVSFVATVLTLILTRGYGYVCYVLIAVTLFTFCLHCILNGRIFFHVKNQIKVRQVLEQKKANSTNKGVGESEKNEIPR